MSALRGFNFLIVSLYKVAGFAVLTAILAGLVSYLGVNVFYFFSRTWMAPTIISPTDERVLSLRTQLVQQRTQADRLLAERVELLARLDDAERVIKSQEAFQASFKGALQSDLQASLAELSKLRQLTTDYDLAKSEIGQSRAAYAGLSHRRLEELVKARMVPADSLVSQNYQLSQLKQSDLHLAEREASLKARELELQRQIDSLSSIVGGRGRKATSSEQLKIEQEMTRSVLELERAKDSRTSVRQTIVAVDNALAGYQRLIQSIEEAPYLKAAEKHLTVAFVPYENLRWVREGGPVYGCRLAMIWCNRIGKVEKILDGEVSMNHPLRNQLERGVMVQAQLEDAAWAGRKVLFANRPPLGL